MTDISIYEERGKSLLEQAHSLKILDEGTREQATTFVTGARRCIKAIEAELKPDIQKAHELHTTLLARLKRLIAPFKSAQTIVDREIGRDYMEQEQLQRKAEVEERRKVEAEAEVAREQLRKAAVRQIEEGKVDDGVDMLEAAEAIEAQELPNVAPQTARTIQTSGGSTTLRKMTVVTCIDKLIVVKAIAEGHLPATFVDVNDRVAKRYVVDNGMKQLAGFRIEEKAIVVGKFNQ